MCARVCVWRICCKHEYNIHRIRLGACEYVADVRGELRAQTFVAACFPAQLRLHSVLSVPPQNEQLKEDVNFYRDQLNKDDTCAKEKFQKKLGSANRQLEQCLDDLQVPLPAPPAFCHNLVLIAPLLPCVSVSEQKMKTWS